MRLVLPKESGRLGFTLIELMVVVVIIGIVSAVIIPEMRGTYQDALLRATSRELVNVFDIAASQAVSFNQICRVRIDTQTGQYSIEKPVREKGQVVGFQPVKGLAGSEGQLDKRITIELHARGEVLPQAPAEDEESSQDDSRRPGASPAAAAPPDDSETGKKQGMPEGAGEAITFYPDGTADEQEILLKDQSGFRLGLQINATTGHVRILELERK